MTATTLDPATARICAGRLEERAELLRAYHKRKGWGPRHHFVERAAELERMAEVLRALPSLRETARRSASHAKAFNAVVAGRPGKPAGGGA